MMRAVNQIDCKHGILATFAESFFCCLLKVIIDPEDEDVVYNYDGN